MKSHKLSLCTLNEIKTNLKDQNVTEIQRIQIKKYGETINTNTYILTFSTSKIPKEIKIGYQKINVKPYIPNPLRCYKCQGFGHHQDQCTQPPVCGRYGEYDIHKDCQRLYKCANCQGNHSAGSRDCEIWKKEKEIARLKLTKKITYPEARRMIETRKYTEVTKKNIPITSKENYHMCETETTTKPEVVAQLVKEMKALIQEINAVIRAVTKNKPPAKKDTNVEITTNKEKQTKNKENPKAPITEVDSITRPPQTSPKRDTTKHSPPDKQGHGPKLGKNRSRSRSRTTPTKNTKTKYNKKKPTL